MQRAIPYLSDYLNPDVHVPLLKIFLGIATS